MSSIEVRFFCYLFFLLVRSPPDGVVIDVEIGLGDLVGVEVRVAQVLLEVLDLRDRGRGRQGRHRGPEVLVVPVVHVPVVRHAEHGEGAADDVHSRRGGARERAGELAIDGVVELDEPEDYP